MTFEYIRAIDPTIPHDALEPALEPIVPQARPAARPGDEPEVELEQLVAKAREAVGPEDHASLAAPWPLGIELPSFVGVPLVCERLEAPQSAAETAAEPPRGRWRAWLDPGAVTTMTLALAATLAFGMFVVTR